MALAATVATLAAMSTFTSTSYGPPWGGIQGTGVTATGVDLRGSPQRYLVAVDPTVIPLGTHLHINPNPFGDPNIDFLAADTGGAIKGNRIDFYDWRGRQTQTAWGSRSVEVSPFAARQAAANPGLYPALRADPGVDLQHESPVLLRRLNDLLARQGKLGEVISGYRTSGVGGAAGFQGDPHSKGLGADVLVNGQPIADALGWQTVEAAGLRSGADPRLQPFYQGGPDPSHVDLMDASGHNPMDGVTIFGQTAATGPYPTMPATPKGSSWTSGLLGFLSNLPTVGPVFDAIDRSPAGGAFSSAAGSAGAGVLNVATGGLYSDVSGFFGTISDPRFWLRVLVILGGVLLVLAGLVLAGRRVAK